jgi:hypothetical protein
LPLSVIRRQDTNFRCFAQSLQTTLP